MSKLILGGGISGLSAAYYLTKRNPLQKLMLLEASDHCGGWIKSTKYEEGYIFEQGPRTIRPHGIKGANTLELVEELGLNSKIQWISRDHSAAKNRMIYVNGTLHSLPSSLLGLFKTQTPFSKPLIRFLMNDLITPQKLIQEGDESIYNFVERRLGKEIADYAISPLICGICAGDAKEISVKFLMENLFNNEQKYGNITKGILYNMFNKSTLKANQSSLNKQAKQERWSIYSFHDGLETLPNKLEEINKKNGLQILLNTPCIEIEINSNKVILKTQNRNIKTEHLISCISAKSLGPLLKGHTTLKELLMEIPFVNVCVINLHFDKSLLSKDGFGFLIPPKENLPILGVIFDSCCFEQRNKTILTIMMGGHWFQKHFGSNPDKKHLLKIALDQLKIILGITEKPKSYKINILNDCIPQYVVGHSKRIDDINRYIKINKLPLTLCGASYYGVGINDVIYSTKTAIDLLND